MHHFKTSDKRYDVEDQLDWMLLTTYEIEMHLNAIFFLIDVFDKRGPLGNNYTLLWTSHDDLAMIKTSSLFKPRKPRANDDKHSLRDLQNFLDGKCVCSRKGDMAAKMTEIDGFCQKYHLQLDRFINRRDTAAHAFKVKKMLKTTNNNSVDFVTHQKIIREARELIQGVREILLGKRFENESIDVELFNKIYISSIDEIAKRV